MEKMLFEFLCLNLAGSLRTVFLNKKDPKKYFATIFLQTIPFSLVARNCLGTTQQGKHAKVKKNILANKDIKMVTFDVV